MIRRVVSVAIAAIIIVALALLVALVVSTALLGVGTILSRFFDDVTLFQATALATAVAAVLAYLVMRAIATPVGKTEEWEYEDEDWEDEDWEDEDWEDEDWEDEDWYYEEEEEPEPEPPRITQLRPKASDKPSFEGVRRNDPCPCGSGKKYKHCHGKKK